jgi:hypothetical protein
MRVIGLGVIPCAAAARLDAHQAEKMPLEALKSQPKLILPLSRRGRLL